MHEFKPMLAPNQSISLNSITYPILASYKMDGCRVIIKKGEILSRALKQIPNKQLRKKLQLLAEYSEQNNLILDGEIYSPNITFQEIIGFCMSQDLTDIKSIKRYGSILEIPNSLKFYCFDVISKGYHQMPFQDRITLLKDIAPLFGDIMVIVSQYLLHTQDEVKLLFQKALDEHYEGLILRNPSGYYKYGRGTIKEGLIYKMKPFQTWDSKIIDVLQATEVNPNVEKKINELGYSVTSKRVNDRILIKKASAFLVKYKENDLKVVIALTDEEKEEIWKNKENYIGKWIEYKGMTIGSKNLPRHPVFIRFIDKKTK